MFCELAFFRDENNNTHSKIVFDIVVVVVVVVEHVRRRRRRMICPCVHVTQVFRCRYFRVWKVSER